MNDATTPLPDDLALCHEMIRQQAESLRDAHRRVEQLEHAMQRLLRQLYGPRTERVDPDQLRLFDEPDDELAQPDDPSPPIEEKPTRTWRRRGRQRLPEHLPRERVVLELSDEERACPGCGQRRMPFGEEVSEQLDYVPASLFIRQFVRPKYACSSCQARE